MGMDALARELKRGSTELLILALLEEKDRHGYELAQLIEDGPQVDRDGVVRWRCIDLQRVILMRWEISYHERTIGKLLRRLEFRHISARPRHLGQEPAELEAFKKTSPAGSARSPTSSRRRPG